MFVDNLPFLKMWQELSLLHIPLLSGPAAQIIPMKECISPSARGRLRQLDSAANVVLFETDLQHCFPGWELIHGEASATQEKPSVWLCMDVFGVYIKIWHDEGRAKNETNA